MITVEHNDAFWQGTNARINVANASDVPSAGLEEFVESSLDTRSLVYFRTSGSEGVPKWVGLSREAMLVSAKAVNEHLESSSGDRWIIALPLHHVGGFSILARCHASRATWSVFDGRWGAVHFARQCEDEEITLASLVPTQVYDLVKAGLTAPASLRAIVVGGGGMNREVALRGLELGWPVLQSFGMTEAASQIATEPLEHLRTGYDPEALEVLPCWELHTDDGDILTVHGAALASGYAVGQGEGQWTWQPIDGKAGLTTRDLVQLWHHGRRQFLRFLGREAAFVKVLGELVSLPELQSKLEGFCLETGLPPTSCLVWPVADVRQDTRLVLVGEIPDGALEALRVRFNAGVQGFQRLGEAHWVESIPRTALGKVDRVGMETLFKTELTRFLKD